ncbi:hypothetical protein LEP1GSC202_2482 [Leptospira yanagawae serovar Saopaulo str. Sao Paulo = ATCC 700523]|uniref:SGNH/GDSL hydrolase family protein n=1 Tax=Leptospira yanagawae serovar Saopaulo str. Sao Paulo = ATCC 700523 TaxID=1249483 RepID=A0A5E8HA24_9LEPT|nr:hypothetical protein [Leptospira yanagawae]EOQ87597.1 hypothetical protein LEP1GSC202_2482 [Leptospira yanagawae serovar Saopaulo str. Sao Paulo = ATCC 700523]
MAIYLSFTYSLKKSFKYVLKIGFGIFFLLFLGEGIVRFYFPDLKEELRYKQIHCLQQFSEIRLCPEVNETFTRKDGKPWDIQTNHLGERTVSMENPENSTTKVWLIGDSMAMGYGLPTNKSIAYLLKNKFNIQTRVLAVDAIGTNGILSLYLDIYNRVNLEGKPTHIYWIWNPSDFIDDEREKKGFRKLIYPIHFYLSRFSVLYNYAIRSPKANVYEGSPILYPKSHTTYTNLKNFFRKTSDHKEHIRILFSWGMAPNGTPDTRDPNYEHSKVFFTSQKIKTIDLRRETEIEFAQKKQIYIPEDGHPDEDLAELFASAIAKDYKNSQ